MDYLLGDFFYSRSVLISFLVLLLYDHGRMVPSTYGDESMHGDVIGKS